MKTGAQYKSSLADGRAVYFQGRRIDDMAAEPAFAVPMDAVAAEYDEYYSSGDGAVNAILQPPRSAEELRGQIPAFGRITLPLQLTYQAVMTLLVASRRVPETSPELGERIAAYIEQVKRDDLRLVLCITDAKGDRKLSPSKQDDPDLYLRVVDRQRDGVVIRGAKLHISGAPMAHELMVMPTKAMKPGEEDWSIACVVPANATGVRLITKSYHPMSGDMRDYPVSSRVSMPISLVVFDDVFVPNERIFLDGHTTHAAAFAHALGLWVRLSEMATLVSHADELVGLAQLIAEANGIDGISHIRDKIDEMIIHATVLRAGLDAAVTHAHATDDGYFYPDELFTNATKYVGAAELNLMFRHLHDIAGGSVVTAPSMADYDNGDTGADLEKYMRTGPGISGKYRMALFNTIRDATADTYGGWQLVTHLQGGGGLFAQRLVTRKHYDMHHAKELALRAAGLFEG
jgi:4-hydroxybutyryl-CoA dehydratase/vinylacetyl-CoA-Delta-isomerase